LGGGGEAGQKGQNNGLPPRHIISVIPIASSANCRIVEWFGLEGTLHIIIPRPRHGQGHLPLDQVA